MASGLDDPKRTESRGVWPNEPEGFVPLVEEEWDSFDEHGWWHTKTNEGSVEIRDGRLTWTYPAGKVGGSVPGAKVTFAAVHGPYQYHRDEGVVTSENFHGHQSGVNKFRYWQDRIPATYIGFFGADETPLMIGMNVQGWAMKARRMRWDSRDNYAAPSRREARVQRGVPHTIESLIYRGTEGQADGWVKVWLNGVLVLDFRDLAIIREGERLNFSAVHFAPVWGGMGDSLPVTQTLSVDRTYVSVSPRED